jgi:hypothetical protein
MTQNEVLSQLRAVLIGWNGLLKDPNFIRDGSRVTWADSEALVVRENLTRQDTLDISRRRQFSFRIAEDDSLIQIGYNFSRDGTISEARLAYYEVGQQNTGTAEVTEGVIPAEDFTGEAPVRWLRFDYTNSAGRTPLHAQCHLHISGLPGVRVAVVGVPKPKQFVEFVIALFYDYEYASARLDENGLFRSLEQMDNVNAPNSGCGHEQLDMLRRIPHIRIPGFTTLE